MTLLEQALAIPGRAKPKGPPLNFETLEVALAFFEYRINAEQMAGVLKCSRGNAYVVCAGILRKALVQGLITIMRNKDAK
jgi:hypothetical protein